MRHLELFSGIGGFRRALDLLTSDGVMPFESIGYSEIDERAASTYRACYKPQPNERVLGDIVKFTADADAIRSLAPVDIITGGFPCQAFSMMGLKQGFKEDRGQLFFRITDIIDALGEQKPRYLLLENVKNLQSHDNKNTYKRIRHEIEERGYTVREAIFNTAHFGLPQKRSRIYIFATTEDLPGDFMFDFSESRVYDCFKEHQERFGGLQFNSVLDILEDSVDPKYFLSAKVKPTILSDGTAGYKSKSEINQVIARTLTATMHKMHRACQDNYYSQDFIASDGKNNPALTLTKEQLADIDIRKITPEEAFMLQGFPKEFVLQARAAGVSDGALYTQAGNAVSVNVVYTIVQYLIECKAIR